MISFYVTESVKSIITKSIEVAVYKDDFFTYIKGYSDYVIYTIVSNDLCTVDYNIKFKVPDLLKSIEEGSIIKIDKGIIETSDIKIVGCNIQQYTATQEDLNVTFSKSNVDNSLILKCNSAFTKLPSYSGVRIFKNKILYNSTFALLVLDSEDSDLDIFIDKEILRNNLGESTIKQFDRFITLASADVSVSIPRQKVASVNNFIFADDFTKIGEYSMKEMNRTLFDYISKPIQSILQFRVDTVYPMVRSETNFIGSIKESDFSIQVQPKIIQLIYRLFSKFELYSKDNIYRFDNNKLHLYIGAKKC